MNLIRLLMLLFPLCLCGEQPSIDDDSLKTLKNNTDLKVLVLIIASDGTAAYLELQKIWKAYMHMDPDHFDVYFIRGNPDLPTPYEIKGDDLFVKTEEGYVPGIVKKTILSIESMLPKLKEYDYVLRTNLSSFYVFPRLLDFVRTLPRQKCYCGVQQHIPGSWIPQFGLINYISGGGILLSSDLAEMLVREKEHIDKISSDLPDDVLIGYFFQNRNIGSMGAPRSDFPSKHLWLQEKDNIPNSAFHFRAKSNYDTRNPQENYDEEIFIDLELLKMFYPNATYP